MAELEKLKLQQLSTFLPDIKSQLEEYVCNPERLPIHDYRHLQKSWSFTSTQPSKLVEAEVSYPSTELKGVRNRRTGIITHWKEVCVGSHPGNSINSLDMTRIPGRYNESVKGNSRNMPFSPGWLTDDNLVPELHTSQLDVDFENDLLTVPPGFEHGMDLSKQSNSETVVHLAPLLSSINMDLFKKHDENDGTGKVDATVHPEPEKNLEDDNELSQEISELHELTALEDGVLRISASQYKTETDERLKWAVIVDVSKPMIDFHLTLPFPAHTWPFELDTFQKKAILHLEHGHSVFVAAHTSAGKTVIAEYAVALAQKHMTRVIYTSPIKALSNQKFRDFRQTFGEDVGLLTGDIQLNPTASCLVMTTEILKSMLYRGSNIIRDLQYVVFDEVHYINDSDRGHVWEEVLIMLPPHVVIVMLSATVPNTAEFAGWVGRIKQRKIYVVSTPQRPVPLEHYLYVSRAVKSKPSQYLVLDSSGRFNDVGYRQAVNATVEESQNKSHKPGSNGKGDKHRKSQNFHHSARHDEGAWRDIVKDLRQKNLLPSVAFTLSRKRCNQYAESLKTLDLTDSSSQVSAIRSFLKECLEKLKPEDRELPQIMVMSELLLRGIGVHHSGILPILREVVEMLFQKGLVKLLFATETFAMGVNMPARTVVFDAIDKYDGKCRRNLLPAEYIQMAGRAGRRGIDDIGTVMLLCKNEVPPAVQLQSVMTGRPNVLQSQFRLTYFMILTILRTTKLTVEDFMKHSFAEDFREKDKDVIREQLREVESLVSEKQGTIKGVHGFEEMVEFYNCASQAVEIRNSIQDYVMMNSRVAKEITPGRIIITTDGYCPCKLALVLMKKSKSSNSGIQLEVLELYEEGKQYMPANDNDAYLNLLLGLLDRKFYVPEGVTGHIVRTVSSGQILSVTKATADVDTRKIKLDWENRQIPRFRDNPPGQSCKAAISQIRNMSKEGSVETFDILQMERDAQLVPRLCQLYEVIHWLSRSPCTSWPDFQMQFGPVVNYCQMKEKVENLKFRLSPESVELHPEYLQRVHVLRELGYVDRSCFVQLKGQVACKMSDQELMLTEMIFHNTIADKPAAELAALLSALVFQEDRCSVPLVEHSLKEGIEEMKKIAKNIGQIQVKCGMKEPVGDFVDQYKFGLVEVIHAWALGQPFKEIVKLTDVQEGVIVRCIQRIVEILHDIYDAAKIIGNPTLQQKMIEVLGAIKRDIAFTASLYTEDLQTIKILK